MASSYEVLREHQRLRVGHRFLAIRPWIVLVGAIANASCLALSPAPSAQKVTMAAAFAAVVLAFFAEAWWLGRRPLTAGWLGASLVLTLLALALGASLSGALASPLLPLVLTPVVVAFAAFGRSRASAGVLVLAALVLLALFLLPPIFPAPPAPWSVVMTLVGALMSLALLAVGVTGLVDAHAQVAATLERMRADVLAEAERRAASVENLGAQVAHEVKNPLTAVRGLVQLVARKVEDPRDQERLGVVVTEVDRALAVLQEYLAFARPLSDLAVREVDLRAVLDDVAGVIEARSAERAVTLTVEGAPLAVPADPQRLRDALLNLALNAIDAMPQGGPLVLSVGRSADDGARIVVSDGGRGMSPELVARIGQPFTSESEGGTGLGVLVARGVVAQHGGTLRFESAPRVGTRAIIELPVAPIAAAVPERRS